MDFLKGVLRSGRLQAPKMPVEWMYSGRGGEQRQLRAGGGHGGRIRLGGKGGRSEEGELAGAGDPVGGGEAGLRVFVGCVEAVALGVVETHVHLGRVGRPQPGDEFGCGAGGVLDFKCGREGLPEVLDADGESSAEVAGVGEARGALARGGVEPGALRPGALDDGESVGVRLDQFEARSRWRSWRKRHCR